MCLLTYLPRGVMPNLVRLNDGCEANSDGFGYAIVTDREILVGKGLKHESVLLEFNELRRQYPEGPALFHSRIGTHGLNSLDNCHPFYVAGDRRTVLAHNGILPISVQPKKGDVRSDTRIAAEWIPRHMGRLSKDGVRRNVERWMGKFNKIVILTIDPRYRQSAYILNEDAGLWEDDDCWYSNTSYRWGGGWTFAKTYMADSGGSWRKGDQTCVVCSTVWVSGGQTCPWCHSCQECMGVPCVCDEVEYRDSLKLPDDGHGACPACQSYYACNCTAEDVLVALGERQAERFGLAVSKEG